MSYDHLTFFKHSERNSSNVGGFNIPNLINSQGDNNNNNSLGENDERSITQKLIDVVDYLQTLLPGQRATVEDIYSNCFVYLEGIDVLVLEDLRNNPKIKIDEIDGILYFRYLSKYEIRNRQELLSTIDKVKNGILRDEVSNCYPGISHHIDDMILSGEIIACKNKELKQIVLFPRGPKFLSQLSGMITAYPMRQNIRTSENLTNEIRRGDAIFVGENWYRVASAISSTKSNQPERAKAPLSVTSVSELSERNVYVDEFNQEVLPLDGDYDGTEVFTGPAFKHGCTNDLRDKWHETSYLIKQFKSEKDLLDELLKLNLISNVGNLNMNGKRMNDRLNDNDNDDGDGNNKKQRNKKRINRNFRKITNVHLQGTELARQLALEKSEANRR